MDNCPNCEEELTKEQGIWTCSNCDDEYEDIPLSECQKEKEIAERIREELLSQQKIKFRLVRDWDEKTYGRTKFSTQPNKEWWKNPIEFIALTEKSFKNSREKFIKTITHELGHASNEVRFHPDFDIYSQPFHDRCEICKEKHRGVGHDEVWHDAFLSYQKRILRKEFTKNYLKGPNKK